MKTKRDLDQLKRSLVSLVGNKMYMRDIDTLLQKISENVDVNPAELDAIRRLATDISWSKNKSNKRTGSLY